MQRLLFPTVLLTGLFSFGSLLLNAQTGAPSVLDYSKLPERDPGNCSAPDEQTISNIYFLIDGNKSKKAVELSNRFTKKDSLCPEGYQAAAWALFNHGQWERAIPMIDEGIKKYGGHPDLVFVRGEMSFYLAELGAVERNVDGNQVFNMAYTIADDYDPQKFKSASYLAALNDFEYLVTTDLDREYETYRLGIIHQRLGNYSESNRYLSRIEHKREYANEVKFMKVVNYIDTRDYTRAEKLLKEVESLNPNAAKVHEQYVELYKRLGKVEKVVLHQKKHDFATWVPSFIDLEFNETNYQDLHFLIQTADEGDGLEEREILRAARAISRADEKHAVKILVSVLYAARYPDHTAVQPVMRELQSLGAVAVPELVELLKSECPSTLPATWAAEILSRNGDQRGWDAMVECLPNLDQIPFSVVPPPVPECMVRLNQDKALPILLKALAREDLPHRYHYLYPLKHISESKIRKMATGVLTPKQTQEIINAIREVER